MPISLYFHKVQAYWKHYSNRSRLHRERTLVRYASFLSFAAFNKTYYYLQMLPQLHFFFLDMLMKVLLGEGERGVFLVCVCVVDRCLIFYPFSFGVVCSSSIKGFWLPFLYLQALLNASRIVFILSIFVQNQICTRNSFTVSTKMSRTMCHMLWPLWLQQTIFYLARIWNESGSIGLLHRVLSLNNVHKHVFRGIHDRIIKTKAMTNTIVTLVTNPARSHNWGRKLDDDDNNRNISIVICDTAIRSPHFL